MNCISFPQAIRGLCAFLFLFAWVVVVRAENVDSKATIKALDKSLEVEQADPTGQGEGSLLKETLSAREQMKQQKIVSWMRQASVAQKNKNWKIAESFYLQVLSFEITPAQRREVLLEMAKLFEQSNEPAKQAAALEKFGDAFQDDPGLPQVFIKLGILYRDLGLYKLALARFYSVLNFSLKIDPHKIDAYRQLSIRAQIEIANTHFAMGAYPEAVKFYSKLRMLDLDPEDRATVVFQLAYSLYLQKSLAESITAFDVFIKDYPGNEKTAQAMFYLTDAYSRLGRNPEASRTALALLKKEKEANKDDEKQWIYWQKRAGNQLANVFFNQGDYSGALSIYQAMMPLGKDPAWQWPLMYQLGMCFEHLAMNPKAQQCYQNIVGWKVEAEKAEALKDETLASTYNMAKWRIENIDWKSETSQKLEKLIDKSRE